MAVHGAIEPTDEVFDSHAAAIRDPQHWDGDEWRRPPELSVVIPCLDEAETIAGCVFQAQRVIDVQEIEGEIIVADNASNDASVAIAQNAGARVVQVDRRGYGSALMGGIAQSRGRYIIMADADGSYDFSEIPVILERLRSGYDLVMGCRLSAGGGRIAVGAMPFLHRICGNPFLSLLVRRFFGAPVHDVYCGLRGFSRALFDELHLRCSGMEFACEMVAKASLFGKRIVELPITLHPDRRRLSRSHLRTFRDGWTTLCLLMMCCPRWLFFYPGLMLILCGGIGYALAMPGFQILGAILGAHTLLVASLAVTLGYQSVLFALFATAYGISSGLFPHRKTAIRISEWITPGRGSVIGAAAFAAGLIQILVAANHWRVTGFSSLDYAREMRLVVPGVMMATLGFQTVLAGFFSGILRLGRAGYFSQSNHG